jgi:quercetin dioxygenase-like cupin family protein
VWQTAVTALLEVAPAFMPPDPRARTVLVDYPAGDPGAPPHRHSGPAFGYVLEGELLYELEGLPEQIFRPGEAFWEPGGAVVHYREANHRDDIPVRFTLTMLYRPGSPLLTLVSDSELVERRNRRARHR